MQLACSHCIGLLERADKLKNDGADVKSLRRLADERVELGCRGDEYLRAKAKKEKIEEGKPWEGK